MSKRKLSPKLTFILGGARGGKSACALRLAESESDPSSSLVLFVATAEANDDDMARRIEKHRLERPPQWQTLEEPICLAEALQDRVGDVDIVIIDCLTLWVSNILLIDDDALRAEEELQTRVQALLDIIDASNAHWIIVSNEVGMGLVPSTRLGRDYRDLLGRVNQKVAACAERVVFMVAGRALELRPL